MWIINAIVVHTFQIFGTFFFCTYFFYLDVPRVNGTTNYEHVFNSPATVVLACMYCFTILVVYIV